MKNELAQYGEFIKHIKELIFKHQYEAMKQVNKGLLQLYWEIGEEICLRQHKQGWRKAVVEILSKELQKEFPGDSGYTARNLWFMRQFYLEYTTNTILKPLVSELEDINGAKKLKPMVSELETSSGKAILPPLVADISWSKNIVIIQKCKDPLEREFYIKITKKYGWTKNVLINNIENSAYEKYLTNQTNFDQTIPDKYKYQAKLAVKDEYNFKFLEMGLEHSEEELEAAIIKKIRAFLIEMGGLYTFIGNQYHLNVDGDDCYIDLLLYHRQLRSLIAIELKVGDFMPEYTGKMQYYLAVLNDIVKLPDENPSIGIIVCQNKKRTKVEYALKLSNAPIGVATYTFHKKLPKEMQSLLPSADEIALIIKELENDNED